MTKPLQIRNVPDEVHAALRRKAEREGLSLSAYALRVLEQDAAVPTLDELFDRIDTEQHGRVPSAVATAAIRAERDARA